MCKSRRIILKRTRISLNISSVIFQKILNRLVQIARKIGIWLYQVTGLNIPFLPPIFDRQRDLIKKLITDDDQILEIGPFNRPIIKGENVKYFDILNSKDLKIRAKQHGLDENGVPYIDFVDPNGDLKTINNTFDKVISAHVIEHQPDLILHLQNVENLLNKHKKSTYIVIIPDKRYCFDRFIPESSVREIIRANQIGIRKPEIWSILEHRALITHNDSRQHWLGKHGSQLDDLKKRWDEAMVEVQESSDKYVDVHCWQFTPESFASVMSILHELQFTKFKVSKVVQTFKHDLEFSAFLSIDPQDR